jgi:hypothetical protein
MISHAAEDADELAVATSSHGPDPDPIAVDTPTAPTRDPSGRFLRGNRAAVTHALYAMDLPEEFSHLASEISTFRSASIADDGGETEIGVRRQSLHEYRARIHRRIVQLDHALELRGLVDRRGKLRVSWLQRLDGLIASARALDSLLGLDRRARQLPSLSDYLASRPAADAVADAPAIVTEAPTVIDQTAVAELMPKNIDPTDTTSIATTDTAEPTIAPEHVVAGQHPGHHADGADVPVVDEAGR